MKTLNYDELISYASSFVAFVLPKINIEEIILFGSLARKEATKKSDIDIFFNTKENEEKTKEIIKKELIKFAKTKIHEIFQLKGSILPIKIEVGNLDNWKLKRSIIADGITLYGKYKEIPKDTKAFIHFTLKPIKKIAKRNKIIRKLFGRKEKKFTTESLVSRLRGKKLTPLSFIIPQEKSSEIIRFLQSEKADFSYFIFWTDEITV